LASLYRWSFVKLYPLSYFLYHSPGPRSISNEICWLSYTAQSISVICFSRAPPIRGEIKELSEWKKNKIYKCWGRRVRNYITGLWNFYLIQPIGIDSDLQRRRMPAFNTLVWFEWPFPLADSSNDVFIRFRTKFFWLTLGRWKNSEISVRGDFLYILFSLRKKHNFSNPDCCSSITYNDLVSFYRAHDHYFYFGRLVYLIRIFR